jgi:DNA-binding NarL/FixJ family response regulator
MNERIRILVVDDHPVLRKGLVALFSGEPDLVVCAEAASIGQAEAAVSIEVPDVAVIDLVLGDESGLELVALLAQTHPTVRALVLSAQDEGLYAERALKCGALGYVMKVQPPAELLTAVRRVATGKPYVSTDTADRILSGFAPPQRRSAAQPTLDRLSSRERHVLTLLARGLTTREIAQTLDISVKTIETHYAHLKEKLGARNGRDLVRLAVTLTEGREVRS